MNNISPFAERLKTLLRERGLTHREVAEAAGVTKNAVGKWIRGTVPGAGEVFKMAQAFNKPMEWFFGTTTPAEASEVDKTALHLAPEDMPANQFLAAAKAIGLSPRDQERLIELSLNYRPTWKRTADGGLEMHYEPVPRIPGAAPEDSSKKLLPTIVGCDNIAAVHNQMERLRARLLRATAVRGQKAALAKWLGVPLSSISTWLSGRREPGGEVALRLLQWVEQQRPTKTKAPGSVSARPGAKDPNR